MRINHVPSDAIVVYRNELWNVETRVGGVYLLTKGTETARVLRRDFKRYIPGKFTVAGLTADNAGTRDPEPRGQIDAPGARFAAAYAAHLESVSEQAAKEQAEFMAAALQSRIDSGATVPWSSPDPVRPEDFGEEPDTSGPAENPDNI